MDPSQYFQELHECLTFIMPAGRAGPSTEAFKLNIYLLAKPCYNLHSPFKIYVIFLIDYTIILSSIHKILYQEPCHRVNSTFIIYFHVVN